MAPRLTCVVTVSLGVALQAWIGAASAQPLTAADRDATRAKLVEGCLTEARDGGDVEGLDTPTLCRCSAEEVVKHITAADLAADESPRMEAILKAAGQTCARLQSLRRR